jgi:hypothetical protein
MEEIWKDISGHENVYQISNFGRIKSLKKRCGYEEKIMKQSVTQRGYMQIILRKNGYKITYLVHRLVLQTFIKESLLQVNHKNGVKTDNRLDNLEYCTGSENMKHAHETGLQINKKGELSCRSKLSDSQVKQIKDILKNPDLKHGDKKKIAQKFNVVPGVLYAIEKGITWKHIK